MSVCLHALLFWSMQLLCEKHSVLHENKPPQNMLACLFPTPSHGRYDTMRATNYGSALFFVFWIIIGKYVLLTLFLAVTLEAFESRCVSWKRGSWTT